MPQRSFTIWGSYRKKTKTKILALICYHHPSESLIENEPPLSRSQLCDALRPHSACLHWFSLIYLKMKDSCDSAKFLIYEGQPSSPMSTSLFPSRVLSFELYLDREIEGSILESSNFLLKNIGKCEFKNYISTLKKIFLRLKWNIWKSQSSLPSKPMNT